MYPNHNSDGNLTELVFENKNKAYGAYAIRRSQSDSITVSLLITATFFGLMTSLAIWASNRGPDKPDTSVQIFDSVISIDCDFRPDKDDTKIEPEKSKPADAPRSTSGQLVVVDTAKTGFDPNDKISNKPNPDGKNDSLQPPDIGVKGGGDKKDEPEDNEVKVWVEVMPSMDGMEAFIRKNLIYPQIARENNTSGTVVLSFVVEKDGRLTDIKVLKGLEDGCQEAAVRVVKMMPAWHPGTLKDIPMRTQCTLPIKFRLKSE